MDNFAAQLAECESSLLRICRAIDPEKCDHRVLLIAAESRREVSAAIFGAVAENDQAHWWLCRVAE